MSSHATRLVLHVGCGRKFEAGLHKWFRTPDWREIRYDIDPSVEPDIVGNIIQMERVGDAAVADSGASRPSIPR